MRQLSQTASAHRRNFTILKKPYIMHAAKTATIVDVRTPDEFAENHFPDALTIPLDQV